MVKYDLKKPLQNYPKLYPAIKACGMAWHAMAKHVVRHLVGNERLQNSRPRPAVDPTRTNKVFVSRLSTDSAWCGLEEKGSDWLKKHM